MYLNPSYLSVLFGSTPNLNDKDLIMLEDLLIKVEDYDKIIKYLIRHQTAVSFYKNISRIKKVAPRFVYEELSILSILLKEIDKIYFKELRAVFESCQTSSIDVIALKAFHFLLEYPEYRGQRIYSDADLLVREDQLEAANQHILNSGFNYGAFIRRENRTIYFERKSKIEASHYELTQTIKEVEMDISFSKIIVDCIIKYQLPIRIDNMEKLYLIVGIDLHWNVAHNVDSYLLWERKSKCVAFDNVNNLFVLSVSDTFWYLTGKLYLEVFVNPGDRYLLRYFYELYLISVKSNDKLDLRIIKETGHYYGLEAALYYVCTHLREIYDLKFFIPLLEQLDNEIHKIDQTQNLGDFMPLMFDLLQTRRIFLN